MTKRTKQNFKLIVTLAVLAVLVVFALKTLWVGFNLMMYSNEVIESGRYANEYYQIREEANAIYESVNIGRANFYNSSDVYVRWLSNLNNFVRIPFGLLMIFSPYIYVSVVRNYNINKRRRRRTRG